MLAFWSQLDRKGYDHAQAIAAELKKQDTSFKLPESDINDLAFILLGKKMKTEAIAIFKYNLAEHPNSADAFDGLAEGYDDMGEKELAIRNFKKSVELNPKNGYAAERIRKLQGHWIIGHWSLVNGHWSLVIGQWSLVIGHWVDD